MEKDGRGTDVLREMLLPVREWGHAEPGPWRNQREELKNVTLSGEVDDELGEKSHIAERTRHKGG